MRQRLRFLLLFGLFVALGGTAHAQQNMASETFKQRLRGKYLQNDTAQAIITLYSIRQMGGASWVAGGVLAAVRIATGNSGSTNQNGYGSRTETPGLGLSLLVASPFLAYGVGKIIHYSNANLEHILIDYAAGKPLARGMRRKLKPRFFRLPIMKYQRVPVQAVPVQPGQKAPAQMAAPQPAVLQAAPVRSNTVAPGTDGNALPVQEAPALMAPEQSTK